MTTACQPAKENIEKKKGEVYMFSYFKNNGADGLHMAYSRDGLKWKAINDDKSLLQPTAGGDKLMRDPCIIKGPDGLFHMVWTVSWGEQSIGYASSPDLIHWSNQKTVPVMTHESEALNCWAPEVYYDKASKQYMIYWSTTIPGRFTESEGTGDNKYNHRMYYVTTKDFKTFSETALLYDHGFNVIDGTIQKVNGKYVMFLKDETKKPKAQKNIRVATADKVTGPYTKASEPITGNYWAEGPTATKLQDNRWVVYFDKYTQHAMGAVASKDLKTWTDISSDIVMPKGLRHGTVFKVDEEVLDKVLERTSK
ncbi:glycoside hydrolase family 43 protein [Fulvitalea axinellae]